jgi:PAS domain-containing protein
MPSMGMRRMSDEPGSGDQDTLLERLLQTSSMVAALEVDAEGTVTDVNDVFARRIGEPRGALIGRPIEELLLSAALPRVRAWLETDDLPPAPARLNFATPGGNPFTLRCLVEDRGGGIRLVGEPEAESDRSSADELMRLNNEFATMVRELARRERELVRTRGELESALEELRTSYWHLQKIQEVLPLCMECGKVKTGSASWQTVMEYLKANEIFLSHGYCPECGDALLRQLDMEEGAS